MELGGVDPIVVPGSPAAARTLRSRRFVYGAMSLALTTLLGLAVAESWGAVVAYGVDTSLARTEGGGYRLGVRYATVSRPALATPFEITVDRSGGFDGPVTVAVTRDYLALWDENGLSPAPSAETTLGEWLVWEFDPPPGERFSVAYDGRIEPGAQTGTAGRVALMDDDVAVAEVSFRTRVLP